jgi:hypothetical protein
MECRTRLRPASRPTCRPSSGHRYQYSRRSGSNMDLYMHTGTPGTLVPLTCTAGDPDQTWICIYFSVQSVQMYMHSLHTGWNQQSSNVQQYFISVADPGSGAFLTPGSGIGFSRIPNPYFLFRIPDPGVQKAPDPGSQTHIFEMLVTIFWMKSYIIL